MDVQDRDIDSIRPYENNPRLNKDAIDGVARSISEYGWRQPIVVDKDGIVVCGHTRLLAARKLGLKTVPVHVATDLTPAQVKAYRLADNRLAEIAEWNMDLHRQVQSGLARHSSNSSSRMRSRRAWRRRSGR